LVEFSKSRKKSIKEIVRELVKIGWFGAGERLKTILELKACGFWCEDER